MVLNLENYIFLLDPLTGTATLGQRVGLGVMAMKTYSTSSKTGASSSDVV